MRILYFYVGKVILLSILAVLFVIVALDAIFEMVDQLGRLKNDYDITQAILFTLLNIPDDIYEFIPLSALVGCLMGLGSLASSSELVVMRASGVTTRQLVTAVFFPILLLIALGTGIGEYVAPYTGQLADSKKALALGRHKSLKTEKGVWNREGNEFMHFNAVMPNGKLYGITRFQFDNDGVLASISFVEYAIYHVQYWFEQEGTGVYFEPSRTHSETFTTRKWHTDLSPKLLNVIVLKPDDLPMSRLHQYSAYLEKEGLDASDYRLSLWQRVLQPLATLSLVIVAISFILGPLRQTTMGYRVFVGVIVGLVFQMAQRLLGPASLVWGFSPFIAVFIPIIISALAGIYILRKAAPFSL